MEFQDKSLKCVDCGAEFVWTAGEQVFFADKNFKNEPKRCKTCKTKRAARPSGPVARERVETVTHCSACGTSHAGAGASGHTSSARSVAARTRVPATFEMTMRDGTGSLRHCAGSAGISSSSAWPDSTRFSRAPP